jgi:hypothetical protein
LPATISGPGHWALPFSLTSTRSRRRTGARSSQKIRGAGLSIAATTPAHARCLIGSVRRDDISVDACLEAQRTGCVRSLLTPAQYKSCLDAQPVQR